MAVRTVMDDVLEQAVTAGRVPGVVAMAANADGPLYEGAFGKRTFGGDVDMTLDTVFFLASMTKVVTCVAAMQQVERGNVDLDEPIARVLPELAAPNVLEGFDASGAPILRPASRPITLRQLLSHSSGFAYDTWNGEIRRYMQQAGVPSIGTCKLAALHNVLASEPGTRWEYGIGIDWAGQVVERLSGLDLNQYFAENILQPLGMSDTGFLLRPGPARPQGRRAPADRPHLVRRPGPRDEPAARVLHGRRRALLGRAGLPRLPPDAPQRRHATTAPRCSSLRPSPK